MMKRLSHPDGKLPKMTKRELIEPCRQYVTTNFDKQLQILVDLELLKTSYERPDLDDDSLDAPSNWNYEHFYSFTDLGLDVVKRLKAGEEEIEIPIYERYR